MATVLLEKKNKELDLSVEVEELEKNTIVDCKSSASNNDGCYSGD